MYGTNLEPTSTREDWGGTVAYSPAGTVDPPIPNEVVMTVEGDRSKKTFGTTTGEITVATDGTFSWIVDVSVMRQFCPGPHRVGIVASFDSDPAQIFIGTVQIMDGLTP